MNKTVRDAQFDLVVVAAPRVAHWPSVGARLLALASSDAGLKVAILGGGILRVTGVIPLPGTGALVIGEDPQGRVHRIQARAVVKFEAPSEYPDPFPGWWSDGLIPLGTAIRLHQDAKLSWGPATAILGTGNGALKFGASLLESGVPEVICIEALGEWGGKRFAGWEVERRRFEMLGGRIIEAKPVRLSKKAPGVWELRVEDPHGIRLLEVRRVVSAGPFGRSEGLREYPPGSSLFELDATAPPSREIQPDGWMLEEERARLLAGRIAKRLARDLGDRREQVERSMKKARVRLKRFERHMERPFTPGYQGKWTAAADAKAIRDFPGVPRLRQKATMMASIECFEEIACNLCERKCPTGAIDFSRNGKMLDESLCTACGICVNVCPSGAAVMIHEREEQSFSRLVLPWRGARPWAIGESVTLANRRGDSLGQGRISGILSAVGEPVQLVQVEVPVHLAWEARGLKRHRAEAAVDEEFLRKELASEDPRIEATLEGERRLLREKIPVSVALFETGKARPEDALLCMDGSCGLCAVWVDGVKKLACQTLVRPRMAVRIPTASVETKSRADADEVLCPCMGVTRLQIVERIRQGNLMSPEAVTAMTHVGEGKCHGQVCSEAFRRVMVEEGVDAEDWIDWRFPWTEWKITP